LAARSHARTHTHTHTHTYAPWPSYRHLPASSLRVVDIAFVNYI
jgi:hypothetical protein